MVIPPILPGRPDDIPVAPLPPSPLFPTAVQLERELSPTLALPPGTGFVYDTATITRLLQRINPTGASFAELQAYVPYASLSPEEQNIMRFLLFNEGLYRSLARLDGRPETLSPRDITLAAQLAGDMLRLESADLRYLQQAATQPTAPAAPAPAAGSILPVTAGQGSLAASMDALLRRINPDGGVTLAQLRAFQPPPGVFQPDEQRLLAMLQSAGIQRALAHLVTGTLPVVPGLPAAPAPAIQARADMQALTPDIMKILALLISHPLVYSAVPVLFVRGRQGYVPPVSAQAVDEAGAMAEETSVPKDMGAAAAEAHLGRVKWHMGPLRRLLEQISPDGIVSLKALRHYKPRTDEERKILRYLRNARVFEILADLDGHGDTLAAEDIRLAVEAHTFILRDPHLALVILP